MQPVKSRCNVIGERSLHHELRERRAVTRREFVKATTTATAACALGGAGLVLSSSAKSAALVSSAAKSAAPVWATIPNQQWEVGQPVFLDLSDFVTDPDGDALSFSLDSALPPGVTLNGSVISGTPVADFPTTQYEATADDGTPDAPQPNAPTGLIAE